MLDDRHRVARRAARLRRLHAFLRKVDCFLRRTLGNLHTLQPDIQPRVIHHREHCAHSAKLGPDQFANTVAFVAKCQNARRRCINTHLMFDRYDFDIVRFANAAICRYLIFGHQKQ